MKLDCQRIHKVFTLAISTLFQTINMVMVPKYLKTEINMLGNGSTTKLLAKGSFGLLMEITTKVIGLMAKHIIMAFTSR